MYGMPGMPDILLSTGQLQPRPVRYEQGQVQGMGDGYGGSFRQSAPPMRLHQRAPKLGAIGRSRKVVIEDEDLDDMLNNRGGFPLAVNLSPVA